MFIHHVVTAFLQEFRNVDSVNQIYKVFVKKEKLSFDKLLKLSQIFHTHPNDTISVGIEFSRNECYPSRSIGPIQ